MLTFTQAIEDLGPIVKAQMFFDILRKENPNHDELGRFTSDDGSGGGNGTQHETPQEPRIVSSAKMQQAVLRNTWVSHGADLDYEDVWNSEKGNEQWEKEVSAWNSEHGTDMDANGVMDMNLTGPNGEFLRSFEAKYLEGNKAPFPGVRRANEYFADTERVHLTAFTSTAQAERFLDQMGVFYTLRKDVKRTLYVRRDVINGDEEVKNGWEATEKRKTAMDFSTALAKGNPHRADMGRYSSAKGAAMHAHPEGTLVRHKETGRLHLVQGHTDDGKVATTGGKYSKDELEGGLLAKSQPSAGDVHATTAIGNGKKRKAKDFISAIAETKGVAKANDNHDEHGRFASGGGSGGGKSEGPSWADKSGVDEIAGGVREAHDKISDALSELDSSIDDASMAGDNEGEGSADEPDYAEEGDEGHAEYQAWEKTQQGLQKDAADSLSAMHDKIAALHQLTSQLMDKMNTKMAEAKKVYQ